MDAQHVVISKDDVCRKAKNLYNEIRDKIPAGETVRVTENDVRQMVVNNFLALGWTISPEISDTGIRQA